MEACEAEAHSRRDADFPLVRVPLRGALGTRLALACFDVFESRGEAISPTNPLPGAIVFLIVLPAPVPRGGWCAASVASAAALAALAR